MTHEDLAEIESRACREFICQIVPANLETNAILGRQEAARLRDLLPFNARPNPLDAANR
jgi:cytidine deaminase